MRYRFAVQETTYKIIEAEGNTEEEAKGIVRYMVTSGECETDRYTTGYDYNIMLVE